MSGLASGVGLISGFPIADVVDQLIALESRPKQLVQQRNAVLQSQSTAFAEISAKLLSLKLTAGSFANDLVFNKTTASSSDESVLAATSGKSTVPGTYKFTVDRLVSTQQMITRGYGNSDSTAIAPAGATFTFESASAKLSTNTSLSQLNGGEGVSRGKIRITDRAGASETIDLSRALTVDDVLEAINSATTVNVTASVEGDGFVLTDNTGATTANLAINNVGLTGTATSLGLAQSVAADTISGTAINTTGENTLLASLNDGNGVRTVATNDLTVTDDSGSYSVSLSDLTTLGDVKDAIETASGGAITVGFSGAGIELTGAGTVTVAAANGSNAAADLGILGSAPGTLSGGRLFAGLNSRLLSNLNGGSGSLTLGTISIDGSAGVTAVDLSSASSVDDVLRLINNSGAGVTAAINDAGNGVTVTDDAGGSLTISDTSGDTAAYLNIAGTFAEGSAASGNLQLRYVSEATQLTALNGGKGVTRGIFRITDSDGATATVDLTQGNELTIGDVIDEINSRGLAINARVNDTGDGITLEDTGGGVVAIEVEEEGSTTASDLGLLGAAANPGDDLLGSFEKTVTVDAADTLQDIVNKINDADIGVAATLINDGSSLNPFRLSFQAEDTGVAGAFIFDDGGADIGADTLVDAENAVVFYGSDDPAQAIAITSTRNQLTKVVPGATIDLLGTSDRATTITVSRDDASVIEQISSFVENFNGVVDAINKHDSYDQETEERGLLLGDSTVLRVRSAIYNAVLGANNELSGQFNALSQVGIKVGQGARLQFDQDKFLAALETDSDAVEALFSFEQFAVDPQTGEETEEVVAQGIGKEIDKLLARLTDGVDGTIQSAVDTLQRQIDLNTDRIESLDEILEAKRARLEAQFIAMERALAEMQGQGAALAQIQAIQPVQSGGGGLSALTG